MDKQKIIDLLETSFQPLTDNQRKMLKEKFNYHGRFEWATDDWGYLMISASDHSYINMKHFLGLEYEESGIDVLIKADNKILVSYANTERVSEIVDLLEKNI